MLAVILMWKDINDIRTYLNKNEAIVRNVFFASSYREFWNMVVLFIMYLCDDPDRIIALSFHTLFTSSVEQNFYRRDEQDEAACEI